MDELVVGGTNVRSGTVTRALQAASREFSHLTLVWAALGDLFASMQEAWLHRGSRQLHRQTARWMPYCVEGPFGHGPKPVRIREAPFVGRYDPRRRKAFPKAKRSYAMYLPSVVLVRKGPLPQSLSRRTSGREADLEFGYLLAILP